VADKVRENRIARICREADKVSKARIIMICI
jgi:hypothetical protein